MTLTGLRHFIGSTSHNAVQQALSSRFLPLSRAVPHGISPWYDVQRILGRREVGCLFDVGANIGQTAFEMVRYNPASPIHCFEPASEPFERLRKRAIRWRNVHVHRLGLGRETAEPTMSIATGVNSELNTLVDDSQRAALLTGREQIKITSLDRFCTDKDIAHIGILKMDVQGWELEVLAGAERMLTRRNVDFILAEAGFDSEAKDMLPFETIHRAITSLGYALSGFYHQYRLGNKAELLFCDGLYVRSELALR